MKMIMGFMGMLCTALIVSAGCNQLVVQAPAEGYQITDWNFMYQHGNETSMICGNAPYGIVGTPATMNAQLTVTEQVSLQITANVTYTDMVNRSYHRSFTSGIKQYYPGYHTVDLRSESNYQVGTYDVIDVTARKV
jgi:hypothetical protein